MLNLLPKQCFQVKFIYISSSNIMLSVASQVDERNVGKLVYEIK